MPRDQTVHLVEDDEAVRQSVALLLSSAGLDVRTYGLASDFLLKPEHTAGCIVTDVRMPEISGLELIDRVKSAGLPHPVIVITGHGDVALAVEAMKRGAIDFIEKPFEDTTLLTAVDKALTLQRESAERNLGRQSARRAHAALSPREKDVLAGLLAGHATKVIARDLGLSPRTVEEYRANVMSKMNVGSLSQLIQLARIATDED